VHGFTQDEAGELVRKMLKILPEEDRIILTLYYLNESGIDEIHAITGISKANIKVKLFRARKKIQENITRVSDAVPLYSLNIQ
jgi:RNA polymerase sigma-70 factor (ECF subfamily)